MLKNDMRLPMLMGTQSPLDNSNINILSVYDNTLGLVCFMVLNAPFNNILVSYILGVSCIDGGNWSSRRNCRPVANH